MVTEVVDEQTVTVASHLQRGFAHVAVRILPNLERVQRQLPADHDGGTPNLDPPRVDVGRLDQTIFRPFHRLVIGHVLQLDQLFVIDKCKRHTGLVTEIHRDLPHERRCSVARKAIQEQSGRRIDRRTEVLQESRINRYFMRRFGQLRPFGKLGENRLGDD